MNVLQLRSDVGGPVVEVVPHVDGVSLVDLVGAFETSRGHDVPGSYGGLPRDHAFDPDDWRPQRRGRRGWGSAELLACECGELGCWPLVARISTQGDHVVWDRFEQPHRPDRDYTGLGPFVFDARQYADALADPRGRRSR